MPTLILVRHAKAEPHRSADRTRALNPQGRLDAGRLGEWLRGSGLQAERAIVSTSTRTRETWELAGLECPEVLFEEQVYEGTSDDLREVVVQTPAEVDVLVLVGHNPAVDRLAWELDDSDAARTQTDKGLPTSAVVVFSVADWQLAGATLTKVWSPRG